MLVKSYSISSGNAAAFSVLDVGWVNNKKAGRATRQFQNQDENGRGNRPRIGHGWMDPPPPPLENHSCIHGEQDAWGNRQSSKLCFLLKLWLAFKSSQREGHLHRTLQNFSAHGRTAVSGALQAWRLNSGLEVFGELEKKGPKSWHSTAAF